MTTVSKLLAALLAMSVGLVFFAATASAHGGGGAYYVDPASPSCMGELARLHANGKEPGNNPDTMNGFGTDQAHPNLDGPYESIQEQAKAFKAYCNSDLEEEEV